MVALNLLELMDGVATKFEPDFLRQEHRSSLQQLLGQRVDEKLVLSSGEKRLDDVWVTVQGKPDKLLQAENNVVAAFRLPLFEAR